MEREKFFTEGRRVLGLIMRSSVLLLLSLRKLLSIHVLMSERQLVIVEMISGVMD